jgi:hypothetical protein
MPPPPDFAVKRPPPAKGPALSPSSLLDPAPTTPLYDTSTLRTLFLDFEDADWENQLRDFHDTDLEVPATLRVDGRSLPDVGARFRGLSSFMMVPDGFKRSFNLSLDAAHHQQAVYGARTLNLLNSHEDPTFLRSVLYLEIARQYLPAPKANHVRLVINGESWGLYVNVEQFNKEFVETWFGSKKGARFKVPGSPGGRGGLEYLGEDAKAYQHIYQLKSKEDSRAWTDLIRLCRTLEQTPIDKLEAELSSQLDIDGVLRFLALENVFINADGYWIRASDYDLYEDPSGKFHIIPYDVNETFSTLGAGPGMPSKAGASGVKLEPLVGLDDKSKPLRSKLLQVPALRRRYLGLVRSIAETWLDWKKLGPIVETYRARLAPHIQRDTRKLDSYKDFENGIDRYTEFTHPCGAERRLGLGPFAKERRAFLLAHPQLTGRGY